MGRHPKNPFEFQESDPSRIPFSFNMDEVHNPWMTHHQPLETPRSHIKRMKMKLAVFISLLIHGGMPFALLALLLVVMILRGMDISTLWNRPEPKPKDLEFVLVPPNQPDQKPINPHTPLRAIHNSRAGGHHDPTKPIEMPHVVHHLAASTQAAPIMPPAPQKHPTPPTKIAVNKPLPQPASHLKPIPKPAIAVPAQIATSPIVRPIGSGTAPDLEPTPVMAPASTQGLQGAAGQTGQTADGDIGNPGPGNKDGPPGVDAIKEPDFGPYMAELQRRIKDLWHPPRGNESKKVVVVFRVNKSGALNKVVVTKSSGEPTADQAAVQAVQQTFPFKPLPVEYTDEAIDIEFTFDYNVFGDRDRFTKQFDNS